MLRPSSDVPTLRTMSFTKACTSSLGMAHSKLPCLSATKPSSDVVIKYINLPIVVLDPVECRLDLRGVMAGRHRSGRLESPTHHPGAECGASPAAEHTPMC